MDQVKLQKWYEITTKMTELKAEEAGLRRELFSEAFPNPVEGAGNKMPLADSFILQGGYKISRTLDAKVAIEVTKEGNNLKPLADSVLIFKPALDLKAWKALTAEQRVLLADLVTEKPGMPELKVVKPARG